MKKSIKISNGKIESWKVWMRKGRKRRVGKRDRSR
jgi:hypothetical protein